MPHCAGARPEIGGQMNSTNWKYLAELIGIWAIVASLIFVGLQMRQESDIAVRESRSDFGESSIELARLLSDHGDVWIKGLNAKVPQVASAPAQTEVVCRRENNWLKRGNKNVHYACANREKAHGGTVRDLESHEHTKRHRSHLVAFSSEIDRRKF